MELDKKTTILLTPQLHAHLVRVAHQQGISLGELIRRACEQTYGLVDPTSRRAAIAALAILDLPISDPATMKSESVAPFKDLP